jgi:hypothetical protein
MIPGMATKKTDLDVELERLYRGPLDEFTPARNDLAKQLRKLGSKKDADRVRALPKPTPSAWAVNLLFAREGEAMDALLAAGKRARAGQREAVAGRGAAALRESLEALRGLIDRLRRRGAGLLAESGRPVSRTLIERIGTDLQALALSPVAAGEAARRWLDRDLDPPGFEVLAGLQLAGAPVVDLAARRAQREEPEGKREEKRPPAPRPAPRPRIVPAAKESTRDSERQQKERQRQEAVERARREREEERIRRRVAVAEEKLERAQNEADSLREEAGQAEKTASDARRRAEAAELAAHRAREKADRAGERLARAQEDLRAAGEPG